MQYFVTNYSAADIRASWESHDRAARAMRDASIRAEEAMRAADIAEREAARKRAIAKAKRNPAVRAFRAADKTLPRWSAPIALLRRADDAARMIDSGVVPENLAALTAEMLAAQ